MPFLKVKLIQNQKLIADLSLLVPISHKSPDKMRHFVTLLTIDIRDNGTKSDMKIGN